MKNLEQAAPLDIWREGAVSCRVLRALSRLHGLWKLTFLLKVPCRKHTPLLHGCLQVLSQRRAF